MKKQTNRTWKHDCIINVVGTVTFVNTFNKSYNIGVKVGSTNGETEVYSYPIFKGFGDCEFEKGDDVEISAHFHSYKYTNKSGDEVFTIENVIDRISQYKEN